MLCESAAWLQEVVDGADEDSPLLERAVAALAACTAAIKPLRDYEICRRAAVEREVEAVVQREVDRMHAWLEDTLESAS